MNKLLAQGHNSELCTTYNPWVFYKPRCLTTKPYHRLNASSIELNSKKMKPCLEISAGGSDASVDCHSLDFLRSVYEDGLHVWHSFVWKDTVEHIYNSAFSLLCHYHIQSGAHASAPIRTHPARREILTKCWHQFSSCGVFFSGWGRNLAPGFICLSSMLSAIAHTSLKPYQIWRIILPAPLMLQTWIIPEVVGLIYI